MAKDKAAAKDAAEDEKDGTAPAKEGEEGAVAEGADDAPKKVPFWKKKKIIIIGAAALLLILGGTGGGLYYFGIIGGGESQEETADGEHGEDGKKTAKADDKDRKLVFYDLGDLLVNLSGEGKRPSFLKLKISIELDEDHDKSIVDQAKPRILDDFQAYLRELRVDDLKGSAGIYRLREELLLRATEAAHPAHVRDVLITEMLVQ